MRPFGSCSSAAGPTTMAVTIMAAGSLVTSVLPTRNVIGAWAPILLLLCHIVQGFATGGEHGPSATYMPEASAKGHRGFFSSFQHFTGVYLNLGCRGVRLACSPPICAPLVWAWPTVLRTRCSAARLHSSMCGRSRVTRSPPYRLRDGAIGNYLPHHPLRDGEAHDVAPGRTDSLVSAIIDVGDYHECSPLSAHFNTPKALVPWRQSRLRQYRKLRREHRYLLSLSEETQYPTCFRGA